MLDDADISVIPDNVLINVGVVTSGNCCNAAFGTINEISEEIPRTPK
jgi:hypothetical protein